MSQHTNIPPRPSTDVPEAARKLAKWLDFQFGGPQVDNQVRGLADAIERMSKQRDEAERKFQFALLLVADSLPDYNLTTVDEWSRRAAALTEPEKTNDADD